MKMPSLFKAVTQWVSETPERALDKAYRAACKIKEIEDKHFQGKPAFPENSAFGESLTASLISEVNGHLKAIEMRIGMFKTSRYFLNLYDPDKVPKQELADSSGVESLMLEKLKIIDQVTARYHRQVVFENNNSSAIKPLTQPESLTVRKEPRPEAKDPNRKLETATQKTGVLPRSFLKTINKIKQEIDPNSVDTEEEVIKKYRTSRYKTAISIKFILFLIIVPLLTHQLTKTFLLTPLVRNYFSYHEQIVFINQDLEEEAFTELKHFEEHLRFQTLLGIAPTLSEEEIEEKLREEAQEVSERFRRRGVNAFANIFADIFSLVAFGVVIAISREEIETVKGFLDETLYSLSDSAKAFLIILFTDMFVGFHSPHGWEVILEGMAHHFGLPENREFNFLFIATFPVILDTVLKYWIFRYLNRISPSAVATYKNMNE